MSVMTLPMPAGLRRAGGVLRHGLGAPLVVLALLAMVVVPLPPVLLDALFSFNIAISLVVLLAVVSVKRPLDFAYFPDHRAFVDESVEPLFGKNVFFLRGDRWREMRNTLTPSFTASKMKIMFDY